MTKKKQTGGEGGGRGGGGLRIWNIQESRKRKKSCGISRGLGFRSYLKFLRGVTQLEALLCL